MTWSLKHSCHSRHADSICKVQLLGYFFACLNKGHISFEAIKQRCLLLVIELQRKGNYLAKEVDMSE